jgi:hypothetical protein
MTSRSQAALHIPMLIALCGALYFPYLGSIPFFDKGEPREALAVQDIVQRGEWLVPLKLDTIPSKPPLMHWSAAAVAKLTGSLTEATVRFPSAFYATLGVLLLYRLGRQIFDAKTALLGAVILATMMVYQDQALSARVDMTLCFFVTASLVLFYGLYRGSLEQPVWFYVFYIVLGFATLAQGPLGIALPGLVGGFLILVERRWDQARKFCLHPGVVLTVVLATGWYVVAVTRGGEGFFDRQIMEENLSRFVGGSGHSRPVYYYIPYLFSQSMPWSLFLPFLLWDIFKTGLRPGNGALFLKLWFVVMFAFFSLSVGKRPVYLLPLYPSLALLLAAWFYTAPAAGKTRIGIYRGIAAIAVLTGAVLLLVSFGDADWFFAPIDSLLRPKDRDNLSAVRSQLEGFGPALTIVIVVAAGLWLLLARSLWAGRLRSVAPLLAAISLIHGTIGWSVVMPAIAQAKSYRDFMVQVNERVRSTDKLYLYGDFNTDSVMFYRGSAIARLEQPAEIVAEKAGRGDGYLIMTAQSYEKVQAVAKNSPVPLLQSAADGPEGDAPLLLVRADVP